MTGGEGMFLLDCWREMGLVTRSLGKKKCGEARLGVYFFFLLCYFCDLETKLFLITRDFLYTSELQTRGNFMLWVKLYRAIPPPGVYSTKPTCFSLA